LRPAPDRDLLRTGKGAIVCFERVAAIPVSRCVANRELEIGGWRLEVDVVAIRDSIRALVAAILPKGKLVFGGHPAITPMIRLMIRDKKLSVRERLVLYQSRFFRAVFPPEVQEFENLVLVDAVEGDLGASLRRMREEMIRSENFTAGVFVGGMEGVEEEYDIFRRIHPRAPAYPIASTGAAARIIFEKNSSNQRELIEDLRYLSLFRRLLNQRPR
jgi:hypothetical protein